MMKTVLSCMAGVALSGCAVLTSPIERPIIEDHSGNLGTFASVAERRMVITKKDYSNVVGSNIYESKFCAEPPPDATQSIASALTAALAGSAAGIEAKPELSVQFAKSLETTAKSLFFRSQGVQLFRDGLYNLCQAYLNGAITPLQYNQQYSALLTSASAIIKDEIDKMPSVPVARAEEAAVASEAAKDVAVKAKIAVAAERTLIEAAARQAEDAAKRAEKAVQKTDVPE